MIKPNKHKTVAQKARAEALKEFGCIVAYLKPQFAYQCCGRLTEHHTHVGGSRPGRSAFRNHDKIIILCWKHHQGDLGLDPPYGMGTLKWEKMFGS